MHARRVNALLCIRILIFPLVGNQVSERGERNSWPAGTRSILPANYALSTTEEGGLSMGVGKGGKLYRGARLKLPTRLTYLGAGCLRGACRNRV